MSVRACHLFTEHTFSTKMNTKCFRGSGSACWPFGLWTKIQGLRQGGPGPHCDAMKMSVFTGSLKSLDPYGLVIWCGNFALVRVSFGMRRSGPGLAGAVHTHATIFNVGGTGVPSCDATPSSTAKRRTSASHKASATFFSGRYCQRL